MFKELKKLLPDKILSPILKKSGGGFLIKISHLSIGFITSMIIARWFGATILGEYTFAITIINFLKVVAVFGFPVLTVREVAKLSEKNDLKNLKKYFITSNLIVLILTLFLSFIYFLILEYKFFSVSTASNTTLKYSIPVLIFLSFIGIHSTTLRGSGLIIRSLLQEQVYRPLFFLFSLFLIYLLSDTFTAETLMIYQVLATIFSFLLGIVMLKPFCERLSKVETPKLELRKYLKKASPFLLLGGVQILNSQIDIFMLGIFLNAKEVGVYKVVYSVSQVILLVMVSMNTTLTPDMAKLYYAGEKKKLEKILVQTSRIVVILILPVLLTYFIFGDIILDVAFGQDFRVGYYALIITSVGMFINALGGPTSGVLNMTGFERYAFWGSVTMCLLNIFLNILFIPEYGIEGAALTTALAPIFANAVWLYHINKKVGISITVFGKF